MKIYINELGHMTKMAAMPIYGKKNFKNANTLISWKVMNVLA